MVAYTFDPIGTIINVFEDLYPQLDCRLFIARFHAFSKREAKAQTVFPDDGSTPEICIHASITYQRIPDLLAHELAHVAAGADAAHGSAWAAVYEQLWNEMLRRLDTDSERNDTKEEKDENGN